MMRWIARLSLAFGVCVAFTLASAQPAAAHTKLVSSNPSDGEQLAVAPTELSFVFTIAIPLNTVTVELIDTTGVRVPLSELRHGPSGDQEVVASVPSLGAGTATARWKVVGPDGHAVTGRVAFTTSAPPTPPAPAPAAVAADVVAPAATIANPTVVIPAAVTPSTAVLAESTVPETSAVVSPATDVASLSDASAVPSSFRWLVRVLSYVAMLVVCGIIATVFFVWPGAWDDMRVRRFAAYSIAVSAVAAVLQLLTIAADVSGSSILGSFGGLGGALSTTAGKAYLLRLLVFPVLGFVLLGARTLAERDRWNVAAALAVVALGTWAFAGHSKSMRWALIGVPVDIVHHGAAAAWLGGLGLVGVIAYRVSEASDFAGIVDRFGIIARNAVALIVATGVIQSFRLVGSPFNILAVAHGRLLLLKIVVVGAMLKIADINRKRVASRFRVAERATPKAADMLRRAMGTELAVGLAVIGVTAAMVVSPPATARSESVSPPATIATAPTSSVAGVADPSVAPTTAPAPTTASVAPALATCTISATLRTGMTGEAVTCLQRVLVAKGYLQAAPSGTFDAATDAAVRAAQAAAGLTVDGVVGPQTGGSLGVWPAA
jgi:copper transport protein